MSGLNTIPELHPAAGRLLALAAEVDPGPAARARSVIARAAEAIGEHARRESSTLSRTGFGLEVAFASADRFALRYTTEVAPPSVPPAVRVARGRSLFEELHGAPLPVPLGALVEETASAEALKFGAWLGARHSAAGDAFKLYVETPPPAAARWERLCLPPATTWNPAATLHMAGFDGERVELYFRAESLGAIGLEAALERIGLGARAGDVFDCFSRACGRPVSGSFPVADTGYSYSVSLSGGAPRFSSYVFAHSLFGGDGRIREAILRFARASGWRFPLYETISAPLQSSRGFLTHHGMFGVVVGGEEPPAITFGLTPPEART